MKKTLLILLLLVLPTILPFFNSRFFYTQDYIFIARQQQMTTVLKDGQFLPRWAPDLRFGEPVFNFYASLPFYVGALINTLGVNVLWTTKILFMLASFLSAVTMFIFLKEFVGQKGAYLGAVLYTYAPYRAVDIYVRGAISEAWAFIFFPLIFYASLLLSRKITLKRICFLALSMAGLFLTHNVTTLMFAPFVIFWWIYLAFAEKKWKVFIPLVTGSLLGAGFSAFFLLPALFERQFIQTKYLIVGYFNFRAHFVALFQFFSTFWGYGSSVWGTNDGLSFQVGLALWAIVILAIVVAFIYRKEKRLVILTAFLLLSFIFSLFLQHNKSAFIWERIPLMAFIQFPWRFLAISVFLVAIMGGVISSYLKDNFKYLYFIMIGAAILVSFSYFRPDKYSDDSFFNKFLDPKIMRTGRDLTKDYLPIWVKSVDGKVFDSLMADSGKILVNSFKRGSNFYDARVSILSNAKLEAPVTYFPGWEVFANDKLVKQDSPSKMGLIRFDLPKGNFDIRIEFKNTPVRIWGDTISLFSAVLLGFLLFYQKRKAK